MTESIPKIVFKQLSQQDFLNIVEAAVKDTKCAIRTYLFETNKAEVRTSRTGIDIMVKKATGTDVRGLRWDYLIGAELPYERKFLIAYDCSGEGIYFVEVRKNNDRFEWTDYYAKLFKIKNFNVHDFEYDGFDWLKFKESNLELTLNIEVVCDSRFENDAIKNETYILGMLRTAKDPEYERNEINEHWRNKITIYVDNTKNDPFSKFVLDKITVEKV